MIRRLVLVVPPAMVLAATVPRVVFAHGPVPHEAPTFANLALGWDLQPVVTIGLAASALGWIWLVRRIGRAHPNNPVPRARSAAWFGGLAAIAVALLSGIGRYDTALFSVHMVQHLLLLFIAAPLLVLAAPVTQVLRAASPGMRRRLLLPVLHSNAVAAVAHPVVAWLVFTVVMWLSHFSPLFDLALENDAVHELEHGLYLGTALLFWWPVVAADPSRRRMGYPARVLYLLLQFPLNSFLGVAILFAPASLYAHYASLGSPYGIAALADQQLAGGLMWLGGDVVFIVAVLAVVASWMRHESRDTVAAERRADAQRAALRERADLLERRRAATDAATRGQPGSGDSSSAR